MALPSDPQSRTISAGLLAWLVPGLGHWVLGHRGLAIVLFVAISVPYWIGLAVGGVKYSVDPKGNFWLFAAEMCCGGYTAAGWAAAGAIHVPKDGVARYKSFYPESDVAQIYLATAGLLNILAILDALSRAHLGVATFHHERAAQADGAAESALSGGEPR